MLVWLVGCLIDYSLGVVWCSLIGGWER